MGIYIHPENETTVTNPKHVCNDTIYLLIVVCSAVSNLNARNSIRTTWGNSSYLKAVYNSTVKVSFILGESNNKSLNVSILI